MPAIVKRASRQVIWNSAQEFLFFTFFQYFVIL